MEKTYLNELRKFVVPEVIFGNGSIDLTARYVNNFKASKPLIVTDRGIIAAGWTTKVEESLRSSNINYAIYDNITPNPSDEEVREGVAFYDNQNCDMLVAVGGGSPIDCAKGIGAMYANQIDILELAGIDKVKHPAPPLLCIPTTSGTSADISQFAIIKDTINKVKTALISKAMVPDVSLIDPVTTTTMSQELTAATGMDALVHAFEAYVSNAHSPITDINALKAISLIKNNLLEAVQKPKDLDIRYNMMMASFLAGLAFSNASLGLVHAMAHSLGGQLDITHGQCNALLLEYVVEYNYNFTSERYQDIMKALDLTLIKNRERENKKRLTNWIKNFRNELGMGNKFTEYDFNSDLIHRLAEKASTDPSLLTNPVQPGLKDIEELYEKAL